MGMLTIYSVHTDKDCLHSILLVVTLGKHENITFERHLLSEAVIHMSIQHDRV